MKETWVPVTGFEGMYEVSSYGNVRSLPREVAKRPGNLSTKALRKGRTLKQTESRGGYLTVGLSKDARQKIMSVHRLVAFHFHEYRPGLVVNHIDFDRKNNRADNLEWVTYLQNNRHSRAADRYPAHTARANPNMAKKLTAKDADEIKRLRAEGMTYVAIAKVFNMDKSNAYSICKGKSWR